MLRLSGIVTCVMVAVVLRAIAADTERDIDDDWKAFKLQYGKKYESVEEEEFRYVRMCV